MEHVEPAGIHSGDSACALPPYSLRQDTIDELKRQTKLLAKGLHVVGLMNVQFAIQQAKIDGRLHDVVFVLEVNPRASRTVPFVSKATGLPLAKIAARCMTGQSLEGQGVTHEVAPAHVSVKEAVLPFMKFPGVDTILGPEMKSTGEVMGVGKSFGEAYLKSQLGAGVKLPRSGRAFLCVKNADQARMVTIARQLEALGFTLFASTGTAAVIAAAGVPVTCVDEAGTLDMLARREIALVIITVDDSRGAIGASRAIRVAAAMAGAVVYTAIAGADAALEAMRHLDTYELYSLQGLHPAAPQVTARTTPRAAPRGTAATIAPERPDRCTGRRPGRPLNLFIRQPFTESDHQQQHLIADILRVIDSANGAPFNFRYLTGIQAESAATFKQSFEREVHVPFTPRNFREHRLKLLDQADAFINIRVGMSESSAFELSYHIFQGNCTPILFLVWKHAPIKTTLLRELEDRCDITYVEFDQAGDTRAGIHAFFQRQGSPAMSGATGAVEATADWPHGLRHDAAFTASSRS
jgi:carbamoyl-phosphate synthase large subunit